MQKKERGSALSLETCIQIFILFEDHDSTAKQENPDLRLEVIVNKSSAIEQHILDNKIDIGLIENQSEHPDIILRPFMEDKLCAIVPPDSSLASKTSITLEELALHPFLMREKGSAGREILDAYFSLKDIHPHTRYPWHKGGPVPGEDASHMFL